MLTITNTIVDPHHGSINEWGFHNNCFYHRHVHTKKWVEVKKISLTPARIIALNKLINNTNPEHYAI